MNRKSFDLKTGGVAVLVIVLIFFIFWFLSSGAENGETTPSEEERVTVSLLDVSGLGLNGSKVSVNGRVESGNQATLSSEVGGVIRSTSVSIGQSVSAGQILVSFDTADANLSLAEAEAGLAAQEARLAEMRSGSLEGQINVLESAVEAARVDLDKVKRDTQEAIESTRRNLLNNDLRAYLADESVYISEHRNIEPPVLSGTYRGEEGEYRVTLYRSQTQSGYSFRYQGPEGNGAGAVNTQVPQSLGKSGLYIVFPEGFANRYDVEWVVSIPNERGVGYLSARDAYRSAKDNREPAIRQAEERVIQREEELDMALSGSRHEQVTAQEAQVRQAMARVESARSQLNKRLIRAPFPGTVSKVSARVGENVGPGQEMVVLVNENVLRVSAQVSPDEARSISVGDRAVVDGEYGGVVSAVSRALDPQTGQVEVQIAVEDIHNNLIVGEYVSSEIRLGVGLGSTLVPLSAVEVSSAGNAVFTVEDGRAKRVSVSLGPVEGEMINITEGLESVDLIVANASAVRSGQLVEVKDR